jgi:hypothetical protein
MPQALYECQEILTKTAAHVYQLAHAIEHTKLYFMVEGCSQVRPSVTRPGLCRCALAHRVGKVCFGRKLASKSRFEIHRRRQLTKDQGAKFPGLGQMGKSQLEDLHIYLGLPTRVRHLI